MVRILHAADLHLDTPFSDSLQKGEARRAKLRSAFTNLVRYAVEHKVDLVLLAGDLFDSEYVTEKTVSLLVREMMAASACRFVIAPGNHDPFTPTSVWARTAFPENVTVFSQTAPTFVRFPDLSTDVYGYAFTDHTCPTSPIDALRPENPEAINILCAHADLGATLSPYAPLTKQRLAATGMDYAALGHIHTASELAMADQTYYAYSGCLEGRGFDEPGYHGALLLEIEKNAGIASVRANQVRFSFGRYEVARVDLGGVLTDDDAATVIRSSLSEQKLLGSDTTLRLILTGTVSPALSHLPELASRVLTNLVYALEVQDRTLRLLDAARLKEDMTIRGAYYRRLAPLLESADEQTRLRAARALALGLSALDEG